MTGRGTVLHVTTAATSLQLLLGPQLLAFRDAGWRVETASAPGPEVARLAEWGIPHHPLRHATRAMAPTQDVALVEELRRLFRRLRPDVVHTHNPKPGVYGRIAARLARVPVVVNTVHGLFAQPHDPWSRRAGVYTLEAFAGRLSHAELVQNVEDVAVLRRLGVPQTRLTLLGNGVDLEHFDPAAVDRAAVDRFRARWGARPGCLLACTVGRLVREKGFPEIVHAAEILRRRGVLLDWVIVGGRDPEKANALDAGERARAERAGLRFTGFVDDMPTVYAACDLFVTASHREGFPRAAMEAAAMRLPIVATDIRGCRQVVDRGTTGQLVPVRDAAALARAMESMTTMEPAARTAMGAAARSKACREFDQQEVIATTLAVYERLVGAKRHG